MAKKVRRQEPEKSCGQKPSTASSSELHLIQKCPFPIREIQTDNGSEFTNALRRTNANPSLFESELEKANIIYHRIRVATPRHNGKVERQHRMDEARLYSKMRMYNLEDDRRQLERYNVRSNDIAKVCLNYRSPNEVLNHYLAIV